MKSTEKIRIIKAINPFDRKSNIVEYKDFKPLTKIIDYIDDSPDEVIVALNGKVLSKDELNELMPINGELIITPIVEGGHGGAKNVLKAVASIAVMVASIEVPQLLGYELTSLSGIALSASIAIGGSLLVNAIFPAPKVDLPEIGDIGLSKETYGWDGVKTTVKQGAPIPVLYGKRKVGGNLISIANTNSNDEQKQYLSMILALTGHKVSTISDIKINNQPIDTYKDVQYDTRLGTVDQTPLSIIPESQVITTVGQTIKQSDGPVQVQTQGTEIEGIQINFLFPYGIFYANDKGGFDSRTVELQIDILDSNGNVVQSRDVKYSNAKAKPLRYSESFDGLTPGQYTVKVTRITKDNTNTRQEDEVRLDSIAEIIYDKLSYPCTSLLGIKALATDQLSGTMPNVTCVVDRGNFSSDDYGVHPNLVDKPSNNPAWAVADILTNESYGGNYELDWNAFQTWADFCSNNGYEINIYFDGEISVWDAALRIAREAKGILKIEGTKVSVTIDEQADPVQLFTVGNIVDGSFKEHFLPLQSRANCCEVTFFNEDHDYQREQFMVYLPEWNEQNEIKTSLTLYGITNYDSAIKHAQYMLNYNKYLTRSGEFDADIDAIACTVGDVVKLQFDVPNWGNGGRIVSADNSKIVLDQKLTFEDGKEYKIVYRLQNDTQIEKTWTQSGTTTTDTIQISLNDNEVPSKYDVYAVGEVDFTYKLVRITSIDRKDDLTRHISWIEYNPSIYTDMPQFPPQPDYDLGDLDAKNLTVSQATYTNLSGDLNAFHLSWLPNSNVLKWRVYYKLEPYDSGFGEGEFGQNFFNVYEEDGFYTTWHFYKETENNNIDIIFDNLYYTRYTFAVCGIGIVGSQNPDNAQQVSIVPTPLNHKKPFFPDNAQLHSQFDTKLHIWWDKAITSALSHYEVSYVENGTQKVVSVSDNQFTITNPVQRDYSFSIVAIDAWEQRSEPLTGSAENAPPSTPSMPNLTPYFSTIVVNWQQVPDNDIVGYNVYASKDENNLEKVAFIQSNSYVLKCNSNETWYVAISAVDPFGEGNLSPVASVTSLGAQLRDYNLDLPLTKGIEWSVSNGKVYWTAGELNYKGNVYSISSGNSAYKYIWWDLSNPTEFQSSNDRPLIGADTWLMAYFDGTNVYPATQNKIQHAGLLQASSITADLIGANEIITESANIKDGVIVNAKIADATITGAKIASATIDTGNIKDAAITNAKIANLDAGKITAGILQSQNKLSYFDLETGEIVASNSDGDKSVLNDANLAFYKSGSSTPYKYLRHIETGTATNGSTVNLTGFYTKPKILVSINSLMSYRTAYNNQDQKWIIQAQDITGDTSSGNWSFKPVAQLELADGTHTQTLNWDYNTSSNTITTSSIKSAANCTKIQVSGKINSYRSTGTSGTYQKRKATIQLQVSTDNSNWSNSGSPVNIDFGDDLTPNDFTVASDSLSANTYYYRLVVTYADESGTFSSSPQYDYHTRTVTHADTTLKADSNDSTDWVYSTITLSYTLQDNETFVDGTLSYNYANLQTSVSSTSGGSYSQVSFYDCKAEICGLYSGGSCSTTSDSVSESLSSDNLTCDIGVKAKSAYDSSYNVYDYASIQVDLSNIQMVIHTKTPQSTSTTPTNTLSNCSSNETLSSATILDSNGIVNWIAIG